MASNKQQEQELQGPLNLAPLVGLVTAFGYAMRIWIAKPGSMGWRQVNSAHAFWGLLSIALYTAFTGVTDGMVILCAFTLLAQMVHRATPAGPNVHSKSVGEPAKLGWTPCLLFFAAIGGVLRLEMDRAAGLYLICASAFNLIAFALVNRRNSVVAADQYDAFLESQHRSRSF